MLRKQKHLILFLIFLIAFISIGFVSATNCWQYTSNTTGQCTSANGCTWKSDAWGSWCQELNCWSLYSQSGCASTNIPGKNCTWQGGGTTYNCEDVSCQSFLGTNQTACENNSAGLGCAWRGQCYTDGYTPPGTDCWSITNQATCGNTTGCKWGQCEQKSCWNYNTNATCSAAKDLNGKNCTWDSSSSYCTENGCWKYYTNSTCANAVGLNCEWKYNACTQVDCWSWDFTNSSTCTNNSLNLSCSWSGSYCNKKSCWNYGQTECTTNSKCKWRAWTTSGWCEEVNCWNWDSWKSGSQSACEGNSTLYNLGCTWSGTSCYKDYTTSGCSNKTTEKECMDTSYCWWQYNNWNNISAGGTCNNPGSFGGTTTNTTILNDWNPGCYVFDNNASVCGSVLGCDNSTIGTCITNSIHANFNEINTNGINCTMINNSQLCTNIPTLSSCCSWQNSSCVTNKVSNSCWDQMKQKNENSCSDAKTKGKCDEISNSPWYMPCQWTNATETCDFKSTSVFGNSSQSLTFIDNKKTCEAAGGKWINENYCEGNISVPTGRCEYKFDDEEDCDKACFACEKYDSSSNVVNATNAKSACLGSSLNYCEYKADTNAPNGIGYCKAKEQFKKGIVSDCDSNCGDCTYLGTSTSNDTNKRPSYFCGISKANSVEGGCKWTTDNSTMQGGYCINKGEKTCLDSCDRCKTQTDCSNLGRISISNQTGSCKWQGNSNDGSCVANIAGDTEICWDAIDNNKDNLIDCADPGCYADSYCGFVSGDCFGWTTATSCNAQNVSCEWVTDKWGSWCDFKGSQCWKYGTNNSLCNAQTNCQWSNGTGSGWCEKDWTSAEVCMGLNRTNCNAASGSGCNWTVDSWCAGSGNSSDWCSTSGGWCDHTEFAPKNCWAYSSTGSSDCNSHSGCSWKTDSYSTQMCEVNWSTNCWQYNSNSACTTGGCYWKNDSWGGWCQNTMDQCWSSTTQSSCEAVSGNKCRWKNESWGGNCEPSCFSKLTSSTCSVVSGCSWKTENGWCEESGGCWNFNQTGCTNATGLAAKCRWKNPGWCDPKAGGFSAGAMAGGGGIGTAVGADCYKYDGNQSLCTNKSIINITCGWSVNPSPSCDVNWNSNCWQYNSSTIGLGCNVTNNCWWNPGPSGGSGWCTNLMDQCWSNNSYQSWNNTAWLGNCTSNYLCQNNSWAGCEPKCFSLSSTTCTNTTYINKCKYTTGWCNPGGMNDMFDNMSAGAPAPLGTDTCPESIQSSVDLCGFGMKDMGDSYGFGANVRDFSNASVCNKEKLSSFVMGMFDAGGGAGFAGGGSSSEKIGSGNETITYVVYLDTDGSTSGGCSLTHNSSAIGYEFRFKYTSEWNVSKDKAVESFNAYKCDNSDWKTTDVKLNVWKKKMCSEIGGPMIAVKKSDLEKFPTLYNSTKDMRVYISTIGNTGNISSPTDSAGPGWTTPGSIDFEINNAFAYGADMAKFEDILRKGFVEYEECFNGIDDNNDGKIDCNDWGCQYSSKCTGLGVNSASYVDTSAPLVTGVKIEEYYDSALIMYDTNKPTNGTLQFYGSDSQCLTLNTSISDIGILKSSTIREYKLWHSGEIYNNSNSLSYALTNDTTYYYKLKVCDSNNKCAISKCSSFKTSSVAKCPYCNFVTRLKAPTGWNVSYDLNTDGVYEHAQGQICGPNAGMKTNYTEGRKANVKLSKSDGSSYIEFLNVSLTKTALNDKVRTLSTSGDVIGDTSKVGLTSESKDKIINNLHPEVCRIKIPVSSTCTILYHCDESGNNCVDRTTAAGGAPIDSTNCIWNVPYCEFSTYKTNAAVSSDSPSSGGGGGGGGGGGAISMTYFIDEVQFISGYTKTLAVGDRFKVKIGGGYHYISVDSVTSTNVKVNITSELQQANLNIGDEKKFDVTNDNVYDLSVKLNSIVNETKAELIVKSISGKSIGDEKDNLTDSVINESSGIKEPANSLIGNKKIVFWIIFGIILIIIVIGSAYWYKKIYKKSIKHLKNKVKIFDKDKK